jgi:hypothetical protein
VRRAQRGAVDLRDARWRKRFHWVARSMLGSAPSRPKAAFSRLAITRHSQLDECDRCHSFRCRKLQC